MFKEPMEINTVNANKLRSLQLKLEAFFAPYYAKNDLAHGLGHAEFVYKRSRIIAACTMPGKLDVRIMAVVAYAHDMFVHEGRKGHEERAAMFVLTDEFKKQGFLAKDEDYRIASAAVKEHRGSYKGEFTSLYSEVVSAADRGDLNLTSKVTRMFKSLENDSDEELLRIVTHIKEKYSREGYARYPKCFIEYQGKALEKFYGEVEQLNLETVKQILKIERESLYELGIGTTCNTAS